MEGGKSITIRTSGPLFRELEVVASEYDMTPAQFATAAIRQAISEGVDSSYLSIEKTSEMRDVWERQGKLWPMFLEMMEGEYEEET
jgi:hypothetical protein